MIKECPICQGELDSNEAPTFEEDEFHYKMYCIGCGASITIDGKFTITSVEATIDIDPQE